MTDDVANTRALNDRFLDPRTGTADPAGHQLNLLARQPPFAGSMDSASMQALVRCQSTVLALSLSAATQRKLQLRIGRAAGRNAAATKPAAVVAQVWRGLPADMDARTLGKAPWGA